jgi:tetratricopeptide (TPR) repeat protein
MKRFLVIGAIGLVLAAGVGGYFYWQLQAISGAGNRLAAKPGGPMPPRPVAAAPLPQIPAATPTTAPASNPEIVAATPKPESSAPVAVAMPKATAQPAPLSTAPKASPRSDRVPRLASGDTATRKRAATATLPEPPAQPAVDGGLRITTQSQESAVQRAYDDLQAGRLDAARAGYQHALRADPRNGDALVGLATIARRDGDTEAAERYYQQAIAADPRNAGAHAGLVSLRGEADSTASESRLKTLIAQQGSDPAASGALNFALGNVYAGQRRWNEAQQAYFKAHSADAEHPDYLYNLAVSLDHLAQGKLAAQFYEKAIKATQKRPGAFDKAQGERRLTELQK